jgi:hypothetical protein
VAVRLLPRVFRLALRHVSSRQQKDFVKRNDAGFALIGSLLVASLATVLLTLVQKIGQDRAAATAPARPTLTSILAEQKLEHLRGLSWGFDDAGVPLMDAELALSPQGALQRDTIGYVDYLDSRGFVLGGGSVAPDRTIYVRRWSIEPLKTNPDNSIVIQVAVSPHRKRDLAQGSSRLVAVRTREVTTPPLSQ